MPKEIETKKARRKQMAANFIGLVSPLVAAFFAIPILLSHLGTERFGLLTLFWALIGYANIFELGLGRSITVKLAGQLDSASDNTEIISTAFILCLILSGVGAVLVGFGFTYLFEELIILPSNLLVQVRKSITYLLYAMPLLILGPMLIGILEAHRRFLLISFIRVPSGIALFAIPAILTFYSTNLSTFILAMLAVRAFSLVVVMVTVFNVVFLLKEHFRFNKFHGKDLLSYGGWLTVSAIIGPVLIYFDRFMLASLQDLTETGIYTTPFEGVVRFLIVASAVVGVMFPRFVTLHQNGHGGSRALFYETMIYVLGLIAPLCIITFFFTADILSYWLGEGYVPQMALITQILCCAVLINAIGHVSQGYIQAVGLASWTGKLHLCELIAYLLYMPWLITQYGATGAATGWLVRVTISTLILYWLANYLLRLDSQRGVLK